MPYFEFMLSLCALNKRHTQFFVTMPGRGFGAAAGGSPRYTMRSAGAPFKTERVEVERHQEEDGGKMI